jgi:hypothetical protein
MLLPRHAELGSASMNTMMKILHRQGEWIPK